ncbi:hypothetical protein EG328_007602 [Venturia inaequalis]|uniref:Uncharacterized protein n=1 Tax=Venturia inaequalis TaxID=5025 RepID=A0A8H3VAG0_VENIN|nr:hypothetical protein EG328_007602 [Venturia inaequalis]
MEAVHIAMRHAVLQQQALPNHPSLDMLNPSFRNMIAIPGPDATPEAITKYKLRVEFYCFLQACGKGLVEYKLQSEDENISQDEIDSYLDGLWELMAVDFRAQILVFFEHWAVNKTERGDADETGGILELFGRLSVG